jgi:hypothetical protein
MTGSHVELGPSGEKLWRAFGTSRRPDEGRATISGLRLRTEADRRKPGIMNIMPGEKDYDRSGKLYKEWHKGRCRVDVLAGRN